MDSIQKRKLLKIFSKLYPNPASELTFKNEYQLIISVVLSAQCTDRKVNEVTPELFKKFSHFSKLKMGKVAEVEAIIRQINYYKTKARNLIALAEMIETRFGGEIPKSFEEIILLPGVGRKTASVVLGELGITETFPVDTHVFRVSQRLGLASGKTPEQIEDQLKSSFPPKRWRPLHHWLIFHGRRVCKAQRPLCQSCTLVSLCPQKGVPHNI